MKWFDRWFFRKWHWAWENKERDEFRLQQAKPARSCSILAQEEAWEDGMSAQEYLQPVESEQ